MPENPLERLEKPKAKRRPSKLYTPQNYVDMCDWANKQDGLLLPFLALTGLCFMRTAEIVRLYSQEDVLCWEDIDWTAKQIHIRPEVAKETQRESDERWIPFGEPFELLTFRLWGKKGMIVPIMHTEFSARWRKMHTELKIDPIPNGMRKSCLSYWLAADPDLGFVKAAAYSGNSKSTIKKWYESRISQEVAKKWFEVPVMF